MVVEVLCFVLGLLIGSAGTTYLWQQRKLPAKIEQVRKVVEQSVKQETLKHNADVAQPGNVLTPGQALIVLGDYHMVVQRKGAQVVFATNQDPPENSCRPAVDVMFRSIANVYGAAVLAVVLTGMGPDEMRGAEVIREAGGQVIAQDQAFSVVWGMPGAVVHAWLAHSILPLSQVSTEIIRKVRAGQVQPVTVLSKGKG